jgi:hypothetical protein
MDHCETVNVARMGHFGNFLLIGPVDDGLMGYCQVINYRAATD